MHTCLLLTLCTLEYTDFDLKNRSISSFIAIGKSQSKFLEKKENFIELIPTIIFNKRIIYFLSIYLSIYLYIYIYPPAFVIPQSIFFHSANNLFLPFPSPRRANAVKNAKKRSEGQQISNCTTANRAILR